LRLTFHFDVSDCQLLFLIFHEINDNSLVSFLFCFQSKIASIVQQENAKLKGIGSDVEEDSAYDAEDFEQLFTTLVNAQDGERTISEPFHLLPYKTVSTIDQSIQNIPSLCHDR